MKMIAGLIGFPLAHSITPKIYGAVFPAMGIDATCEAWVTPPEALAETVARLRQPGYYGTNVTVPHKQTIMSLLDDIDPVAERIGAVNCVVARNGRLTGHNTDLYGFMRSLEEAGFTPKGTSVLLLGAGGAARAVAIGLADAGVHRLVIAGRSRERTGSAMASMPLGDALTGEAVGFDDDAFAALCHDADLVVNCTPVGMVHTAEENQSPLPVALIRQGAWIYDLVYNPPETVLLREAKGRGAHVIPGLEMLIYQGAESIRLYTGREPPLDIMREAARAALGFSG
jgi:shikimate dehydrogenase